MKLGLGSAADRPKVMLLDFEHFCSPVLRRLTDRRRSQRMYEESRDQQGDERAAESMTNHGSVPFDSGFWWEKVAGKGEG